ATENNFLGDTVRHHALRDIGVHQNDVFADIRNAEARRVYGVDYPVRYVSAPITEQHVLHYCWHAYAPSGRIRISLKEASARSAYALRLHAKTPRARRCLAIVNTSFALTWCLVPIS